MFPTKLTDSNEKLITQQTAKTNLENRTKDKQMPLFPSSSSRSSNDDNQPPYFSHSNSHLKTNQTSLEMPRYNEDSSLHFFNSQSNYGHRARIDRGNNSLFFQTDPDNPSNSDVIDIDPIEEEIKNTDNKPSTTNSKNAAHNNQLSEYNTAKKSTNIYNTLNNIFQLSSLIRKEQSISSHTYNFFINLKNYTSKCFYNDTQIISANFHNLTLFLINSISEINKYLALTLLDLDENTDQNSDELKNKFELFNSLATAIYELSALINLYYVNYKNNKGIIYHKYINVLDNMIKKLDPNNQHDIDSGSNQYTINEEDNNYYQASALIPQNNKPITSDLKTLLYSQRSTKKDFNMAKSKVNKTILPLINLLIEDIKFNLVKLENSLSDIILNPDSRYTRSQTKLQELFQQPSLVQEQMNSHENLVKNALSEARDIVDYLKTALNTIKLKIDEPTQNNYTIEHLLNTVIVFAITYILFYYAVHIYTDFDTEERIKPHDTLTKMGDITNLVCMFTSAILGLIWTKLYAQKTIIQQNTAQKLANSLESIDDMITILNKSD